MTFPKSIPALYQRRIEYWDDERDQGNSLIVTLSYGWSFEPDQHEGVRGFDSVREAREQLRYTYPCACDECRRVPPD